jgi:hypothetical protein
MRSFSWLSHFRDSGLVFKYSVRKCLDLRMKEYTLQPTNLYSRNIEIFFIVQAKNLSIFSRVKDGSTCIGKWLCLIAEVTSLISVTYIGRLGKQRVTKFYSSVLKFTTEEQKEKNYFRQNEG